MTEALDDYRRMEREAREEAGRATDPKLREGLETYAALWGQMAAAEEQASKTG